MTYSWAILPLKPWEKAQTNDNRSWLLATAPIWVHRAVLGFNNSLSEFLPLAHLRHISKAHVWDFPLSALWKLCSLLHGSRGEEEKLLFHGKEWGNELKAVILSLSSLLLLPRLNSCRVSELVRAAFAAGCELWQTADRYFRNELLLPGAFLDAISVSPAPVVGRMCERGEGKMSARLLDAHVNLY